MAAARRKSNRGRKRNDLDKRVIDIRRVAKVTAGAKRLTFSAMVAVGNRRGKVGVALGKGVDTKSAIEKGFRYASAHMKKVDLLEGTVPHKVVHKFRAAKVMIKPAGPGTGIIASAPVRAVLEVAGIKNVLTKQLGSNDPISNTYCTLEALEMMEKERILKRRARDKKRQNQKKQKKSKSKKSKVKSQKRKDSNKNSKS